MSKAKRTKNANADLIQVVRDHREPILQYYDQVKDERPILVLDAQRRKLHSYSFEDYKTMLRPESQEKLNHEFTKAIAKNKVLVIVWDDSTQRLVTTTFKRDGAGSA
jgi:siroheme synthase (precorrin-2 oxidase/ferrochelatase)